MVGPERIDRDDDDRTVDRRRRARVAPSADGRKPRPEGGENQDEGETKRTGHKDLELAPWDYFLS